MSQSEPHCCEIAIVGGGCSGALAAVHLLTNGFRGRLTVIEPRDRLGAGLAYSTSFDQHLLNVPAGKMSAFPNQPGHFLEWLRAGHLPGATADSFAPRGLFGEYVRDVLQQRIQAGIGRFFSHIRAEAIGLSMDARGARLALKEGGTVHAKRVVLALGNPASSSTPVPKQGAQEGWYLSPWLGEALRVRFAGERILVVGTGLTAVDSVLALQSQDKPCEIFMLSRRGVLAQAHALQVAPGRAPSLKNRGNLRLMFRELREQLDVARRSDLCWRTVVDALRPISNELWQELPLADKRRFLRHLKRYWDSHRHRMAPTIHARLNQYRESGALQIIAGRIQEVSPQDGAHRVRILLKHGGERGLAVDRILSCTGIHESYTDSPRPLIRNLVESGLARPNDLGMGFRTDQHGALLNAVGRPSSVLFTLGPPRRGELFETTAVPEIRAQAEALAIHLAERIPVFAASG